MKRLCVFFAFILLLVLSMQGGVVRLAILSDIHVTPGNDNEGKLREAVDEINAMDVDAVMVTGDLTNDGTDEQLINVKSVLDNITHPQYVQDL